MVMLFLVSLVAVSVLIKLPQSSNAQINIAKETNTNLEQAKQAVISSVLLNSTSTSLGTFPCSEDTTSIGTSNEGQQSSCSNGTTSIGRLAWRSLNFGHLTDGNGNDFWYVLAPSLRTAPINSDVVSSLTVDGVTNGALALVYSPGSPLSANSQARPIPTSGSPPNIVNYLDGENSDNDTTFISGVTTTTFNDRLVTIKHADIFPVLEKRVLGEFKNYLNAYKTIWGTFPFPATFGNPTTANYIGNTSLSGGFLPTANTGATTTWNTSITPRPVVTNPGASVVNAPNCSFRSANTRFYCDITIASYDAARPPTISISGIVNNIGLRFYDKYADILSTTSSDIRVTSQSLSATVTTASRAMSYSLNASGQGTAIFSGTLANNGTVRIYFRRTPQLSSWVLAATNHYLLGGSNGNNWHHLVYYKVATPFLPGGNNSCGACITINQTSPTQTTVESNVHAIVMSAGWRLDSTNLLAAPTYDAANPAQARPGTALSAYFDSTNNTSAGLIYDNQYLTSTFNDQIEVVE